MSISKILQSANIPLATISLLLVFAVSSIAAMWIDTTAGAKQPGPPYRSPMSVRDDGCYSTLGAVSNISGLLGGASFGLVNAIVNMPVYDWDQAPNVAFTAASMTQAAGLRGPLGGSVVGYAHDFDFSVTPVPNLLWMTRYFAEQMPYDIAQIASIASGSPNPLASTGIGRSPAHPYIANPFIYQQGAIIYPNGIPRFQVITGPLTDPGGSGNWLNSLNPNTMLGNLQGVLGAQDTLLSQNGGIMGGLKSGSIQQIISGATGSANAVIGPIAQALVQSPLLAPATVHYNINGDVPNDNCYEYLTGAKQVPSYAFSVLDVAIPITIPGWLYTPITLLDVGRVSASGMTLYPPGSVNGKDLLDCYGRGTQPVVTGSGRWKLGDFAVPGYGGASGIFMIPIIGQIAGIAAVGLGSWLTNTAIAAAITAAGVAADGAAPGSGSSVAAIAFRLPALETGWETYTSGMAFAFLVPNNGVKRLPAHLDRRVIDYYKSSRFSMNLQYFIGSDGTNHAMSQNGKQFNPDLYAVLKEPYELKPSFSVGSTRQELDGKTVSVDIGNKKTGFEKGSNKTTDPYKPSTRSKGGPTYDDNVGGTNRSFTRASVYRIVMKPGVIPNAIDLDKRVVGNNKDDAYYDGVVAGSSDVCSFFRQKLTDGDDNPASRTQATPSALTGNTSNAGRAEFAPADSLECDFAKRQDGTQVRDVEIRMGSNTDSQSLYQFDEKIPAETPPGTKYCYAVFYDSYSNDVKKTGNEWWNGSQYNYNSGYAAKQNSQYLSKAKCIVSGYKPSMQVRGGDLMVNGGVYTGTNTKDFLASGANPKEQRTYGSWSEYGVLASGSVQNMSSGGSYRTGLGPVPTKQELGYLTFANNRDTSNKPDYGKYSEQIDDGFARVTRQFTAMSDQAKNDVVTRNSFDLVNDIHESGVYKLRANATVDITANGELPSNRSIILLAQEGTTVNIASDIRIPLQYGSVGDISQVVIAPAADAAVYKININQNVSQVDAWLMTPRGVINTCRTGQPNGNIENTPRSRGLCDNTLTVNGPVSAGTLLLRRNGGKDQGDEHTLAQSIPGENFNLRPDAYLWSANYVDNASKKFITTNAVDLPPRY